MARSAESVVDRSARQRDRRRVNAGEARRWFDRPILDLFAADFLNRIWADFFGGWNV